MLVVVKNGQTWETWRRLLHDDVKARGQSGASAHCVQRSDKDAQYKVHCHGSKQVLEKAFHKNAKTCRAGFHKKSTKQDGTHMTIRSQITIPTSISPGVITCLVVFWGGFNPYMSFHF